MPAELSVLPVKVTPVDPAGFDAHGADGQVPGDLVLAQLTAIKHRLTQMDRLHDRMDGLEHALADRMASAKLSVEEDDSPDNETGDEGLAMDQRPALEGAPLGTMQSPAQAIDPEKLDMASRESEMLEAVAALLKEKRIVEAPVVDEAAG